MADGNCVMTDEVSKRVDLTHGGTGLQNLRDLPNYGMHKAVDDRDGKAAAKCSFCGSDDLQTGFGGFGEGFGYKSFKCRACGGTTDFVYRDDIGKYFK